MKCMVCAGTESIFNQSQEDWLFAHAVIYSIVCRKLILDYALISLIYQSIHVYNNCMM